MIRKDLQMVCAYCLEQPPRRSGITSSDLSACLKKSALGW